MRIPSSVRFVLTVFIILTWSCPTRAQESHVRLEGQTALDRPIETAQWGKGEYFANLSFGYDLGRKIGIFGQTAHGNLWGETTAGMTFRLRPGLSLGLGGGVEHYAPHSARLHGRLDYDHDGSGSFIYAQYNRGREDRRIWLDATQMFGKVGVGLLIQMPGGGVGPKVEFRPSPRLGFWIAPVADTDREVYRILVGTRLMWRK